MADCVTWGTTYACRVAATDSPFSFCCTAWAPPVTCGPLLVRHWPGRWLAPDLPGHGGSQPLAGYSFESLAANVTPRAPVVLARGEHDPMVTGEQLAQLDAPTVTLPGLGHNAHVEDPEMVIRLLGTYR